VGIRSQKNSDISSQKNSIVTGTGNAGSANSNNSNNFVNGNGGFVNGNGGFVNINGNINNDDKDKERKKTKPEHLDRRGELYVEAIARWEERDLEGSYQCWLAVLREGYDTLIWSRIVTVGINRHCH
jgi:hypothetical protein